MHRLLSIATALQKSTRLTIMNTPSGNQFVYEVSNSVHVPKIGKRPLEPLKRKFIKPRTLQEFFQKIGITLNVPKDMEVH